jgi:hypothetical protein
MGSITDKKTKNKDIVSPIILEEVAVTWAIVVNGKKYRGVATVDCEEEAIIEE